MARLSLATLAGIFLRIGNTTFGGGDPTITALQRELVESRGVLKPNQYGVVYALARVTPGTNMLAFCAGAGWLLRGWTGAAIAVTAVTLPSALLAIVLLEVFEGMMKHPVAAAAITSIVAAAVGLMFAGAWLLARPQFVRARWIRTTVLFTAAFLLAWTGLLSPFQVLLVAAIAGYFWREPKTA